MDIGFSLHPCPRKPGALYFGRDEALWGVPFDLDRLDTAGSEQLLLPDVSGGNVRIALATSDDGTLVYLPTVAESVPTGLLVWVNRDGQVDPIPLPPVAYSNPTVLPDGKGIAYAVAAANGPASHWTLDRERNVPQPLDSEGDESHTSWSPDGRRVASSILENNHWDLHLRSADGSDVRRLTSATDHYLLPSWSGNGEWVVFTAQSVTTGYRDIWVVRADGSEDPQPLIATPARENLATVSRDGQWIAYESDRSGQPEILVEPFISGGRPRTVSVGGGTGPVWSKDGRELYYRNDDELMAVRVSAGSEPQPFGPPSPLFKDRFSRLGLLAVPTSNYDVAPDGRFLMVEPTGSSGTSLVVVVNWFEELKRLVPVP